MGTPLVYGHRGAPERARENTLASYEAAHRLGADGVELDVRRTVEGALVVHHDATLSDGRALATTPRAQLPAHIPTLEAALDACDRLGLVVNVEVKNVPGEPDFDASCWLADEVVALLAAREGRDRVLVSGFHLGTIDRVRELAPHLPTGFLILFDPEPIDGLRLAVDHGHDAFHPHHVFVDVAIVEATHDAGLELNTWTVDDPTRARELASLGVDGIVTNVPDVLAGVLAERR